MVSFVDLLTLIGAIVIGAVLYVRHLYAFWKNRNVPFVKPQFPMGNLQEVGKTIHSSQKMRIFYQENKGKGLFCGIYFFVKPAVLATDLDFVKNILVRDFQHFHDRGVYYNEQDDPLSAHLFAIEGQHWRKLRAQLTPTFTSGKMKMMCPTIVAVSEEFNNSLSRAIEHGSEIEMKDFVARFTTDVIGTCAFGIDCNSLKDPDAEFRTMGRAVFDAPRNSSIKQFLMRSFTSVARYLHIKSVRDDVSAFFLNVVRETVDTREANNIQRNDFMHLLMQLKNTGKLTDSSSPSHDTDASAKLSLEQIAAQAFLFFLAGFETSSTTMSYCLYELSLNLDIQERARRSVADAIAKHGGQMTYEAISEMHYLDQIINEALRKYPPVSNLIRRVTKDYREPEMNVTLPKHMLVLIPVYAIHHDAEYYPEPELFDPDRFLPDEIKKRYPYSFIPFGEGPRVCIGVRFGMMQARIGLAMLLLNYKFTRCSKSVIPLEFNSAMFILTPKAGLWLNVQKLSAK